MFAWAPIPEPFREMGSLEFSLRLIKEAHVAVAPGAGFGEHGDGHVRLALVENEQRIRQAARNVRKFLEANGVKVKPEKEPKAKAEATPIKKVAG
jgi:alanine-synthesizing transaminase